MRVFRNVDIKKVSCSCVGSDRCIEMQQRTSSAERAERAMPGEKEVEDVSKWIFDWDPEEGSK